MKIGAYASFMSPVSTPDTIADLGRRMEDAGLESLWMGEHVVLFDKMEFTYPGSRDGRLPVPEGHGLLDIVPTFGYLASVTKRLRFGTGVALIPQRNPIYTAKEFATLDWLTGGRIDLGIGVGWCKEEVLACGYGWEDRGERCDEQLDLMIKLWTEPVTSHAGKHFQVQACRMDPKPVQTPYIPLYVGGYSKPAIRRAVKYGRGWLGFGINAEMTGMFIRTLDQALSDAGRSRDDFEIIVSPAQMSDGEVRAFRDLGVDRLVPVLGPQDSNAASPRLTELEKYANILT
jgi:probable F420-dependent oxidoreductase